jgi:exopolysaccharide biosynthesis polyprenyl glycosylphosphotransferase
MDGVLVVAAMAVAVALHALARHHLLLFREPPSFDHLAVLPFLALPLFLAWTAGLGLHRLRARRWTAWQVAAGLLELHLAVFLSLSVVVFMTQSVVNRSLLALFLACSFVLLLAERIALLSWVRYQHQLGSGRERLLLVGDPGAQRAFLEEEIGATPFAPYLVGRLVPDGEPVPPDPAGGPPCLGHLADLGEVLHEHAVDHVLFFEPLHQPAALGEALERCELLGVPASFEVPMPRPTSAAPRVVARGRFPFVTFEVAPKPPVALALKHGADAVVALLLLVVLSPLLLAAAAAILLTMGRPVLFVQERAGLFGRRFRMLKLRTMVQGADAQQEALRARNEMSGPVFKLEADPRVTRLGAFLRRTSLDELPQLLNVVLGQMSLVGPRPLPLQEQRAIRGWQRRRLSMKPGLTGPWQVSGRSGIDFDEWMRLDLEYVDRWSLALDLLILLRTVPAVLLARGAR